MLYVNYSSINLGKKRKWYLVEVREVCAMGIYPISCQKKYIEEELPSRLLNSHSFSFSCKGETRHYSMTEIAAGTGYIHT